MGLEWKIVLYTMINARISSLKFLNLVTSWDIIIVPEREIQNLVLSEEDMEVFSH